MFEVVERTGHAHLRHGQEINYCSSTVTNTCKMIHFSRLVSISRIEIINYLYVLIIFIINTNFFSSTINKIQKQINIILIPVTTNLTKYVLWINFILQRRGCYIKMISLNYIASEWNTAEYLYLITMSIQ